MRKRQSKGHNRDRGSGSDEFRAAGSLRDSSDPWHPHAELDAIYTGAPIGLAALDTELRFVRVNRQLAEINGRSIEEHIGRTVREVVPDLADQAEERMRQVLETGRALYDVEITGQTPSQPGVMRSWIETWLPVRDAQDTIIGLTVVAREVTERRRAEAAADSEAARFRGLLQVMPAGMYMCDTDGVITYFNDRAEEIWGRVPDADDTEHRFCGAFRLRSPDGSPLAHPETPMADAVRTGASVRNREVIMERADGSQVRVSVNIDPLRDAEGTIVGAINVFTDVSALRETEAALRLSETLHRELVEGARSAIVRWRRDGTITYANPYAERLLGHQPGKLVGQQVTTLLPPPDVGDRDLANLTADILENPERYAHVVEENVSSDGNRRWFAWTNRALLDADERVAEVLAVGVDITEQKLAEDRLRELTAELERQVAERSALAEHRAEQLRALAVELIETEEHERSRVAELLHDDLQQLLAGARLQLGAASRRKDPASALADVDALLTEALAAARTLSHHLSPAVLHHAGLKASLEWLVRDMSEQFDLDVDLKVSKIDDVTDRSVKVLVFRTVQELLFNVVKHSGTHAVKLVVSRSDGQIDLTVSDDGKGFEPDVVESSSAPSGFGLLKLRERASSVGGSLEIDSAPGRGARISVTVPLRLENPQHDAEPEAAGGVEAPEPRALEAATDQPFQLVVVDDHQVMREGLASLFEEQSGLTVVGEAADGEQAIELCRRLRPDVVVMDISMPGMDGIEATRRIKREIPELRIIGLSMHDDGGMSRAMQEAGAEAFVSKTVSSTELLQVIYGLYDGCDDAPRSSGPDD
jgi:PAS domain S-box-containing protein